MKRRQTKKHIVEPEKIGYKNKVVAAAAILSKSTHACITAIEGIIQ